jgi:hypothetical protein
MLLPILLPTYAAEIGHRDWLAMNCGIDGVSVIGQEPLVQEFGIRWRNWRTWNDRNYDEAKVRQRLVDAYDHGYDNDKHCSLFGDRGAVDAADANWRMVTQLDPKGPPGGS